MTSDAGWSHSFTFLKLAPALIWEVADRPAPFAGRVQVEQEELSEPSPQAPTASEAQDIATGEAVAAGMMPSASPIAPNSLGALLDLLDTPVALPALALVSSPEPKSTVEPASPSAPKGASNEPPPEPSGEHFMAWLRQSIQTHKLAINDAKALVHTVAGTAYLVSPGVFQRYAQEHLQIAVLAKQEGLEGWQWVQKRFEKQRVHRKQANGLNIWTCEVTGPRKSRRLHGYLLEGPDALFSEAPPDNPYLRLVDVATQRAPSI